MPSGTSGADPEPAHIFRGTRHRDCSRAGASQLASRAEATAIIANARKIVTPNGVELLEKVRIGGIDQWVWIRGADRRNPVMLLINGGPGCSRR